MNQDKKKYISLTGAVFLILFLLLLAVIAAARPETGLVVAVLGLCGLFIYQYLNSPVPEDDDIKRIYPMRLATISILMWMLFPHLLYKMGDVGLLIQFIVPLVVILAGNYYALKYRNFKVRCARTSTWLVLAIASVIISMVYGYALKAVPFHPRDISMIKEPLHMLLIFNQFYQMDWSMKDVKKYFLVPLITGGMITVFVGIVQYMRIPGLNESVFIYWTQDRHMNELMTHSSRRVFSTYYSPVIYSVFIVSLFTHVMAWLYSSRGHGRILSFCAFILMLVILFMVGSKSAFVFFIMIFVFFPACYYYGTLRKLIASSAALVALVIVAFLVMPYLSDTTMMKRMETVQNSVMNVVYYGLDVQLEDVLDETSVGRYAPWIVAMPKIKASPIFGYGPGKNIIYDISSYYGSNIREEEKFKNPFESDALEIAFRYGAVGLLIYACLICHLIYLFYLLCRMRDTPIELRRISSASLMFCLLLILIVFNSNPINSMRIMFSIYAAAGIVTSYRISLQNSGKTSIT